MKSENLLLVADSEGDANMLYAVGMFVPDPFIFLRLDGKSHIVMNDLEMARARKEARHCRVLSLSRYEKKLKRQGLKTVTLPHVVQQILREHRLKRVWVPGNFPHGLARQLRRLGIKVKIKEGHFFEEREFKSAEEVKKISAALMMAEVGLAEGIQALKNSKASRDGRLLFHNVPLMAEKLRAIIDIAIMQAGGRACHTIVACGRHACDPHERGHGLLRANQPIVLDIFPRSEKTGYFGDITRTVVRGRASEPVRKLYHAVAQAQELAFSKLRHNAHGAEIHQAVQKHFEQTGYRTCRHNGRLEGFLHGTGHGVGLDIHEAPRLAVNSRDVLKAGHVVTVEPGLYYPSFGGVRLEDIALITRREPRNLTKFEKVLEI